MTIFIFLEYPLTTSAECISLIIWVPLVVIQDRMFGHNRGIVIGNMNTLFWWMCADKRNIKVINHWLQLSPSHILFFPFPYALHLFFLSRCDKIPRIGKNWTSKFLTNNHLKALLRSFIMLHQGNHGGFRYAPSPLLQCTTLPGASVRHFMTS